VFADLEAFCARRRRMMLERLRANVRHERPAARWRNGADRRRRVRPRRRRISVRLAGWPGDGSACPGVQEVTRLYAGDNHRRAGTRVTHAK